MVVSVRTDVGTGGPRYDRNVTNPRKPRSNGGGCPRVGYNPAGRHHNRGSNITIKKGLLMKLSTVYSCALLLFGLSTLANADSKADIRQLEQEFNAAYAANDLDKYFGYYSDDAVLWFQDGRTDIPSYKKEWTALIKSGMQIQAGTISDMRIRFSPQGDAAIASYLLHL